MGCKAPPSPGAILFSGFFLYFFFFPFVTGAALVLDPADDRKVACGAALVLDPADDRKVACEALEADAL
jgi:hypothetical protein